MATRAKAIGRPSEAFTSIPIFQIVWYPVGIQVKHPKLNFSIPWISGYRKFQPLVHCTYTDPAVMDGQVMAVQNSVTAPYIWFMLLNNVKTKNKN